MAGRVRVVLAARQQRKREGRLDVGRARRERPAHAGRPEGRRDGAVPVDARPPSHARTLRQGGGARRGVGPLGARQAQRPAFVVARRAGRRVAPRARPAHGRPRVDRGAWGLVGAVAAVGVLVALARRKGLPDPLAGGAAAGHAQALARVRPVPAGRAAPAHQRDVAGRALGRRRRDVDVLHPLPGHDAVRVAQQQAARAAQRHVGDALHRPGGRVQLPHHQAGRLVHEEEEVPVRAVGQVDRGGGAPGRPVQALAQARRARQGRHDPPQHVHLPDQAVARVRHQQRRAVGHQRGRAAELRLQERAVRVPLPEAPGHGGARHLRHEVRPAEDHVDRLALRHRADLGAGGPCHGLAEQVPGERQTPQAPPGTGVVEARPQHAPLGLQERVGVDGGAAHAALERQREGRPGLPGQGVEDALVHGEGRAAVGREQGGNGERVERRPRLHAPDHRLPGVVAGGRPGLQRGGAHPARRREVGGARRRLGRQAEGPAGRVPVVALPLARRAAADQVPVGRGGLAGGALGGRGGVDRRARGSVPAPLLEGLQQRRLPCLDQQDRAVTGRDAQRARGRAGLIGERGHHPARQIHLLQPAQAPEQQHVEVPVAVEAQHLRVRQQLCAARARVRLDRVALGHVHRAGARQAAEQPVEEVVLRPNHALGGVARVEVVFRVDVEHRQRPLVAKHLQKHRGGG